MAETSDPAQAKKSRPLFRAAVILGLLTLAAAIVIPAITRAKAGDERKRCVENLKQLSFAWMMYLNEYSSVVPANILGIANSVSNLSLFVCPSDESRKTVNSLAELAAKGSSYQANLPSPNERMPLAEAQNHILLRCPIHYNAALADGSVHMATPKGMSNLFRLTANGK